jgi:hypothetical protein
VLLAVELQSDSLVTADESRRRVRVLPLRTRAIWRLTRVGATPVRVRNTYAVAGLLSILAVLAVLTNRATS